MCLVCRSYAPIVRFVGVVSYRSPHMDPERLESYTLLRGTRIVIYLTYNIYTCERIGVGCFCGDCGCSRLLPVYYVLLTCNLHIYKVGNACDLSVET